MQVHVFCATSLDGFIARENSDIQWLEEYCAEDYGYDAFSANIDQIIMGRNTYEKVLSFATWPYACPVLVLSTKLAHTAPPAPLEGKVHFSSMSPKEALDSLKKQGKQHIYVDGGKLISSFLKEQLITDMVITTIPVLLGKGIPLFHELSQDIRLELLFVTSFPSGVFQSKYQIVGSTRI